MQERIARRLRVTEHYSQTEQLRIKALAKAKADVVWFVHNWCWTYDPRNLRRGKPATIPFDPWPRQAEFLRWLTKQWEQGEDCLGEKSRDIGLTYLCVYWMVHRWLFYDGFSGTFGSRKLELVDRQGDPDSIFEKVRITLRELPPWFLPDGFDWKKHDSTNRLINPQRNSVLTGEGGDDIGRGGRSSMLVIDEFPAILRAEMVAAAASANSDTTFFLGTPRGMGNLFARKRFSGKIPVFTITWRDDPRKDEEWYKKQVEKHDPLTIAQEIDLDYGATGEIVMIPPEWVQASIDLGIPKKGPILAGLDVASSGTSLSVFICRQGPVVTPDWIHSWSGRNTTQTARKATGLAKAFGAEQLRYDRIGVGAGVQGAIESDLQIEFALQEDEEKLKSNQVKVASPLHLGKPPKNSPIWGFSREAELDQPKQLEFIGVNAGENASYDYFDDDADHPAAERFLNLRAEMWWSLRRRFEKTWEAVKGVKDHPISELITIPNSASTLIAQLSLPRMERTEDGRIKVESKRHMRSRGIESPDFADALILAFANVDSFEVLLARV